MISKMFRKEPATILTSNMINIELLNTNRGPSKLTMKIGLIMSYRHRALLFHLSLKYSLSRTTSLWSKFRESLPKNIFNFTIKYLNNTLPTRKTFINSLSFNHSPSCSFCLQSETSQFIVSSCKSYLDRGRYNWRILSS